MTDAPVAQVPGNAGKKEQAATDTDVLVRVTQRVVDQLYRQGTSAEQIAIRGTAAAKLSGRVTLCIGESTYSLIKGDTHAFCRSHQVPETLPSFEELFSLLADEPDKPVVGRTESVCA